MPQGPSQSFWCRDLRDGKSRHPPTIFKPLLCHDSMTCKMLASDCFETCSKIFSDLLQHFSPFHTSTPKRWLLIRSEHLVVDMGIHFHPQNYLRVLPVATNLSQVLLVKKLLTQRILRQTFQTDNHLTALLSLLLRTHQLVNLSALIRLINCVLTWP